MNRRYFLMNSALAAGTLRASAMASPNDTIRVAQIGARSQGRTHLTRYGQMKNVEIAAICDVDESVLDRRLADVERAGRKRPARFVDIRKVLEDKSIDAVSIATPNHSHTMQTIWACQAGKDVYVEKPCSHNMFEARQIVAAAKKYGRMVQQGTNQRSEPAVKEAVEQLRERRDRRCLYGARVVLQMARHDRPRSRWNPCRPASTMTCGWARRRSMRSRATGSTTISTGSGITATAISATRGMHQIDVARWGLGVRYPTKVSATGGHFMFDDDQETPNSHHRYVRVQ